MDRVVVDKQYDDFMFKKDIFIYLQNKNYELVWVEKDSSWLKRPNLDEWLKYCRVDFAVFYGRYIKSQFQLSDVKKSPCVLFVVNRGSL